MNKHLLYEGVKVKFPKKPYKPQEELMQKIIHALQHRQNALLESPTGTGKTLALLCSSLAWQEHMKSQPKTQNNLDKSWWNVVKNDNSKKMTASEWAPKIFYLTRTHKQLDQIIRELNKTEYCSVKMTIFGGREQMCINSNVRQHDNIQQACVKLLRKNSCSFHRELFRHVKENKNENFRNTILEELKANSMVDKTRNLAWNAKEIVDVCHKLNYCPYYASLQILDKDADIIFCPYNYIVDPLIRRRMNLKLENNIFLFDEAHNIEDFCRDCTSFSVTEEELITERNGVVSSSKEAPLEDFPTYQKFIQLYDRVLKLMQLMRSNNEFFESTTTLREIKRIKPLTGLKIVEKLNLLELNDVETIKEYWNKLETISRSSPPDPANVKRNKAVSIKKPFVTFDCLDKILNFAFHMLKLDKKYCNDFRFALMENSLSPKNNPVYSLNVWCMNASVVFNDVSENAASVILTSGTLTPMDTFQSELGTYFHDNNRMETQHILPANRMLIRSVGRGPTKEPLIFTYQHLNKKREQVFEDFGTLLLKVCESVPGGVLCFFPSYSTLASTLRRLKNSKIWPKLNEIKNVVIEDSDQDTFDISMKSFLDVIKNPLTHDNLCTGSLFLAVYRGKIAEGIDFSDDMARAVISVGLPFPNISEFAIQLKMKYNTYHYENYNKPMGDYKKFLLKGFNWLNVQAYRSLNQALGRCIRHDKDWGCLILVDDRLSTLDGRKHLSRWIRENIKSTKNYEELAEELQTFSTRLSKEN